MVKRLLGAGLVAISVVTGAFAVDGNARWDALSNPSILGDISNIQYYPGYINDYQDQVQLSIGGDTTPTGGMGIGPGIGIKSIGNFSVGVLAKNEWTILEGFNTNALAEVVAHNGVANLTNASQNVPHLLLGADLGAFKIGVDLFYELGRSTNHIENTVADVKTVTDAVIAIRNPGAVIGLNLGLGDADIAIRAGYTAPGITSAVKVVNANTYDSTLRNSFGMHGIVGALVTLPMMGADLTAGIDFEGQMFKFEEHIKNSTSPSIDTIIKRPYDKTSELYLGFYIGAQKEVMNQLVVGAEYSISYAGTSITPDTVTITELVTNTTGMTNRITGYAEKSWASVLFLDSMQARIGATYQAVTPFSGSTSDGKKGTDQYVSAFKNYTTWTLTPSIGLGMRKGVFQFDAYVDPAVALNVFKLANGFYNLGGNDIARATLTLDFGGAASSSSSSSSGTTEQVAPAPYTPATESAPVPMLGQ